MGGVICSPDEALSRQASACERAETRRGTYAACFPTNFAHLRTLTASAPGRWMRSPSRRRSRLAMTASSRSRLVREDAPTVRSLYNGTPSAQNVVFRTESAESSRSVRVDAGGATSVRVESFVSATRVESFGSATRVSAELFVGSRVILFHNAGDDARLRLREGACASRDRGAASHQTSMS
jgi:hypothetical protein